jgi:hypothetical protein
MTTVSRDEVWELFREVARRFEETDRKFQDTDRKFQDTDQKFQDTDRKFQETRDDIKKVSESIGRLGNRLGDFVEEMVRPAAVRLFQDKGIAVHEVHRSVEASRDGDNIEIDLLVVNSTDIIAIECKSQLSIDDVNQHLVNLGKLKRLLPSYQDKQVLGAVAAMVLPDNVARYAYKQGLYVIGQSGDHLLIRNDEKFVPKYW